MKNSYRISFNACGIYFLPFLLSPQTVSDGVVYLHKFHQSLHNLLIINIDRFLQRGRILDFQDAETKAFNHYLTALRSGFLFVRMSVLRGFGSKHCHLICTQISANFHNIALNIMQYLLYL